MEYLRPTPGTILLMEAVGPALFALAVAILGRWRGSLSTSGAITAFIVGTTLLSIPLRTFGISLLVFYFIGSRATKVGRERKAALEDGHDVGGGGNRNAWQVLCNSLPAFRAGVMWSALFVRGSIASRMYGPTFVREYGGRVWMPILWCPMDGAVAHGWSRRLLFVTLGHFACCLGDTLASEIGILAPSPPVLITTFKPVPPGTNGAISRNGTLASLAGGVIMGFTMALGLLFESKICRYSASNIILECVLWGAVAGVGGSLIDSLLGATLQRTRYSETSKRILLDEVKREPAAETDIKVVSGRNILSNNMVNFVASFFTAWAIGQLATRFD